MFIGQHEALRSVVAAPMGPAHRVEVQLIQVPIFGSPLIPPGARQRPVHVPHVRRAYKNAHTRTGPPHGAYCAITVRCCT